MWTKFSAGMAGLVLLGLSSAVYAADAPEAMPTNVEARACFVSRWFSFDGSPCVLKYQVEDITVTAWNQKGKNVKLDLAIKLKVLSTQDRVCLPDHLGKHSTLAINDEIVENRRISMRRGPEGWICEGK